MEHLSEIVEKPSPNQNPNTNVVDGERRETALGTKVVSVILFIVGTAYLFSALVHFALNVVLNYVASFDQGYFIFEFLRYFPTMGLIPIILVAVAITFFFTALKIREQSRLYWAVALSALLIIPVPMLIINRFLLAPFVKFTQTDGSQLSMPSKTSFDLAFALPGFTDQVIIFIVVIAIAVLFIKFKEFTNPPQSLSSRAKIFLVVIFLLFVAPIWGTMAYGYYTLTDHDRGFSQMQNRTSFRILRPTYLPKDFVVLGRPKNTADVTGGKTAVGIVYGPPLNNFSEPGILVLYEQKVVPGFDLAKYVQSLVKDPVKERVRTLPLSQAKSGQAYVRHVSDKSYFLYFVDQNDVLFSVFFGVIDDSDRDKVLQSLQ